jgi:hypothetical protein
MGGGVTSLTIGEAVPASGPVDFRTGDDNLKVR